MNDDGTHSSDCDVVVYGRLPNAKGVVCTCEDDEDGDAKSNDAERPADQPAPAQRVILTGDAAVAYRAFLSAASALKLAQDKHDAAVKAFTEAVAK